MMKRIANVIVVVALAGLLSQTAFATPTADPPVPDAGSSLALFSLAIGALAALKRFLR